MSIIADAAVLVGADTGGFREKVSKDIDGVGRTAGHRLGGILKGALLGATAGIIGFGVASVKAFSDAQQAQTKFDFAFSKFPKLADVSKASLEKLATSESHFTKFSKLAFLGAESQLAAFNLTGKQVKELIPIVADYAARTGKDLPEAATLVGKALLGNTRALKEVGINLTLTKTATVDLGAAQKKVADAQQALTFLEERQHEKKKLTLADQQALVLAEEKLKTAQDNLTAATKKTGTATSTYDKVFGALRDKVGGFAAQQGKTLAGQLDILRNRFEEIRVRVGALIVAALTPLANFVVTSVVPALERFGDKARTFIGVFADAVKNDIIPAFFRGFDGPEAKTAEERTKKITDNAVRFEDVLRSLHDVLVNDVAPVFETFGQLLSGTNKDMNAFADSIVRNVFHPINVGVRDIIGGFEAFGRFLDGFIERFRLVFQGLGDIFRGLFAIVKGVISGIISVAGGLIRFIVGIFTGNIRAALHGLGGIFSGLARIISSSIGGAIRVLIGVAESIVGVFTGIIGKVFHAGADIARGFFDGIVHTIGSLASHLPGFLKNRIPDNIRKFFGIHSPSKLMFTIGSQVGEGFNLGLISSLQRVSASSHMQRLVTEFGASVPSLQGGGAVSAVRAVTTINNFNIPQTDPRVLANEIAYAQGRQATR